MDMHIKSAEFVKGLTGPDDLLLDGTPQVAFIGRSNVGKSSVINVLANKKDLARTSSFPGRTQQVNVFLINKEFYLLDLPGYGYAKASREMQEQIQQLIYWYLLDSDYEQKAVVLIVDAEVGLTKTDSQMLFSLEEKGKNVIVVANKIDKLKKTAIPRQLKEIQDSIGNHKLIAFSAEKKIGVEELLKVVLEGIS